MTKKKEKKVVWVVTLPNGRKQEIEESVAQKYFLDEASATPFSHLSLDKVIRLRPVTAPSATIKRPASSHRKAKTRRTRITSAYRTARARRVQRLRAVVRSSRYAAARRIKKS